MAGKVAEGLETLRTADQEIGATIQEIGGTIALEIRFTIDQEIGGTILSRCNPSDLRMWRKAFLGQPE